MLRNLVFIASVVNIVGGVVLIATWATMWQQVPIVVLFIGGSLLIQGLYTTLYLRGDLKRWGDLATGALFAGETLAACVAAVGLFQGIMRNINNADMEMAPVIAGLLMLVQAGVALLYLFVSEKVRPRTNGRYSA